MIATRLEPGDRVQFEESQRWWKVRSVSHDDRFAILTSPFNLRDTVFYTIIDRDRGVRGPDDRIFSRGYETDEEIDERMAELCAGEIQVSRRTPRYKELDIAVVKPAVQVNPDLVPGTRGLLADGVIFGGLVHLPLTTTQVFKNGWLVAVSDNGGTRVKVRHQDFIPTSEENNES